MSVDERALDLGFQAFDHAMASEDDDELTAFRKGVEAYEAAKNETKDPRMSYAPWLCSKCGHVSETIENPVCPCGSESFIRAWID